MDAPGYSELPGWAWLPPVLLGVAVLVAALAVALASRRASGALRAVVPVLGGLALAGVGWWALSPVTAQVDGQRVQCGTASRDAFLRGNPTDATLNQASRDCRSQAREALAEQFAVVILVGGVATAVMRPASLVHKR